MIKVYERKGGYKIKKKQTPNSIIHSDVSQFTSDFSDESGSPEQCY